MPAPTGSTATSIGRRALRNACLAYLAAADPGQGAALAMAQFDAGRNMTDVLAALTVLADLDRPERAAALARFYEHWSQDDLVTDKWFALQARSSLPQTPARVRELTGAPGLHAQEPEPGARARRHFRASQPAAFSRCERRRLCPARR